MADRTKTVDDIMAADPCEEYPREVVAGLVGDGITARVCARLDIAIEDRLWAIIYVWLDDRQRRLLACDCAERALLRERAAGREPDERAWTAVRISRAYARGEATDEELWAARVAARDAAWAAARDAARCAARDAAWAAVRAAARAAARDAARCAARSAGAAARDAARCAARSAAWDAVRSSWAAWDAAAAAEGEWQLQRALAYVKGEIK